MATGPQNAVLRHIRNLVATQRSDRELDRELLARFAQQHDETAFVTLVRRHGGMVLHVAQRLLHNRHDAEDVFQAAFLTLARLAGSRRWQDSVGNWLYLVAYRLALKVRKETARRFSLEQQAAERRAANPLDATSGKELCAVLDDELSQLSEKYRKPLVLCCLEGATRDEAASQLGWSLATLKRRLERGRALLRERLIRRGFTLSSVLAAGLFTDQATRAAMSPLLVQAALQAVAGPAARVLTLSQGVVKGVFIGKLKAAVAAALAVCVIGTGAGFAWHQATAVRPPEEKRAAAPLPADKEPASPKAAEKAARPDQHGDALPESAILRFGSARLRHGGRIWASALSPDGKILATAGARSVIVWDLDTGKVLRRFDCDHGNTFVFPALNFSPDGTRLAHVRNNFFACVWDLRTGKDLRRFERRLEDGLGKFWSNKCQFANQGKELMLLSHEAIHTWNVESGQETAVIPAKAGLLSPDGSTYLSIKGDEGLIFGDARTGKALPRLEVAAKCKGIDDYLAFSLDGKTLAVVHEEKEIQLRLMPGGKLLTAIPLPDPAKRKTDEHGNWEHRVTFSSDGKTLLLGTSGGLIHRWDVATGKELQPLSNHNQAMMGMHTLPDGHTLVSTHNDGVIRRWDLQTGRQEAEPESYEGRSNAAIAPDGRFTAIGDARGRIDLWDGRTGKLLRTVQQEGTAITHLAFAPDGNLLATAERSGTVRFWQMPSGKPGAVWQREPVRGQWSCNGLVFSPDGRLLCLSDYPKQIRVVEVASGKLLWTGQCSYAEAFSPDGATLLVAAPTGSYLTMLEATTGTKRATVRLNTNIPDNLGVMYTLAFSPDGRRVAVVQNGGTLLLCDGRTGAETHRLADGDLMNRDEKLLRGEKIANEIHAVAFSPDSKWFAGAGRDSLVYIWEAATGKEVMRLQGHEAEVSSVAFSPDGRKVFSYGQDGQGYLWDLRPKSAAGTRPALHDLWTDLAEIDASKAYRAAWTLSEDPRAVNFLREKLPPAVPPEKDRVAKFIADLGSDSFEVRVAANRALAELAELAAPAMEEACKTASSLEQRKRLEELLTSLKEGLSPVQILQMRAVQALELAGSTDARKTLQEWARGVPAARLTQEAQAALARLDKHKK